MELRTVKLHDKCFREHIPKQQLELIVQRIANEMNEDLKDKNPLFVFVLNGVFLFAADLIRKINTDLQVSFIKVSSYNKTESSTYKEHFGLNEELKDRTVIIVEDIIDTGNTIYNLLEQFKKEEPKEIKVATLFFKPNSFKHSYKIDYAGMFIGNEFIVGYGLDYDGVGRNLDAIYKLIEETKSS